MNLIDFLKKYPNNEACLQQLFSIRYGFKPFCEGCNKRRKFTKIKGRPVYQCLNGHQVSPLANTVFEKITTPLQYWFYAMFLMTATRGGISAKQLQRELKVTYKTAWRMMKQIRILMGKNDGRLLDGIVEVDESYFGGKGANRAYEWRQGRHTKEVIMGIVQRHGSAYLKHIDRAGKKQLLKQIEQKVDTKAHIMTDEYFAYKDLPQHGYFKHYTVDHSMKQYVRRKLFHTNSVEGLWGRIKPAVKGVYRHVSPKFLESYMDEYCFRYNYRKTPDEMFDILLGQVAS